MEEPRSKFPSCLHQHVSSFLDFYMVEMDSLHLFFNANGVYVVFLNPCMILVADHGSHAFS